MSKNPNSQPVDRYPFLMALDLADELVISDWQKQLQEGMACFHSHFRNTSPFNGEGHGSRSLGHLVILYIPKRNREG